MSREADTIAALGEIELQSESGHWTRYESCDGCGLRGMLAELRASVVDIYDLESGFHPVL